MWLIRFRLLPNLLSHWGHGNSPSSGRLGVPLPDLGVKGEVTATLPSLWMSDRETPRPVPRPLLTLSLLLPQSSGSQWITIGFEMGLGLGEIALNTAASRYVRQAYYACLLMIRSGCPGVSKHSRCD